MIQSRMQFPPFVLREMVTHYCSKTTNLDTLMRANQLVKLAQVLRQGNLLLPILRLTLDNNMMVLQYLATVRPRQTICVLKLVDDTEVLKPLMCFSNEHMSTIMVLYNHFDSEDFLHQIFGSKSSVYKRHIMRHIEMMTVFTQSHICETILEYLCDKGLINLIQSIEDMTSFRDEYPPWHLCKHIRTLTADSLTDRDVKILTNRNIALHTVTLKRCPELSIPGLMGYIKTTRHCLQSLSISGCYQVSDKDMKSIAKECMHLKKLDISECAQLSDVALIHISHTCQKLKGLNIEKCTKITDKGIISIISNCSELVSLKIGWCDGLTDMALHSLSKARSLRSVTISMCRGLTGVGMKFFVLNSPKLACIDLGWSDFLCDDTFEWILNARLKQWEHISVKWCSAISHFVIPNLPRIRTLAFYGCKNLVDQTLMSLGSQTMETFHAVNCARLTERAVRHVLSSCPGLTGIDVRGCQRLPESVLQQLSRVGSDGP